MSFKTPYADLLPPLSSAEIESLRQRIEDEGGVHDPVLVTEDEVVLDGHNRLKIDPEARTKKIPGSKAWSVAQRQAFVIRCNRGRRNLSPEQDRALEKTTRQIARDLKNEGKTQATIGNIIGVSQQRVQQYLAINNTSGSCNSNKPLPDMRVKIPPAVKEDIARRVEAGEPQAKVAADLKISQGRVSQVANAERKQEQAKQERAETVKKLGAETLGVHHGDFRKLGAAVADASVDLIFTDPPYDQESVSLYGDLAAFAARVLRPGGWCLAYSGQAFLPDVLDAMRGSLTYGWTFAAIHSGGDLRFRKFNLQNKWKPIVGFYRAPLKKWWDWFPDAASGGREKSDHEWQQAEGEALHFIEALSPKSGLVCEPFAGSGTTCAAAKKLGRQWVGFEIELDHVETARVRLNEIEERAAQEAAA